jgi:site-specific recombinase XerD
MENLTQKTILFLSQEHYLEISLTAFLQDRQASDLSKGTLKFYKGKINRFFQYCNNQEIHYVTQISADTIRAYMLYLSEVRHNKKSNVHGFFRSLRAFLYWYEKEYEPDNWKNPIRKIKPPKQSQDILQPVPYEVVTKLLDTCEEGTFTEPLSSHFLIRVQGLKSS